VLCVIYFSFSVICVLLILLNSIKLPQSVVEVDLVLCFSILHNLLIYSGNFYRFCKEGRLRYALNILNEMGDLFPNNVVKVCICFTLDEAQTRK